MTGRDKVSNLINSDAFWIGISVVLAIFMWVYVGFIHTDDMSVELVDVPVVVRGQNELIEDGLIATWFNREAIDMTVSGRARDVAKLSSKDVSVEINLSDVTDSGTSAGMYQLSYKVIYPSNVNQSYISVDSATANYISVKVEDYVTKQVPVKVASDATVPEGYQAESIELETDSVKVSGPESMLSDISTVLISIEKGELVDTFSKNMPFVYMSEANEPIVSELLVSEPAEIKVTIPVFMIKELPLEVEFTGKNSATDANTTYSVSPSKITVSGDPSILKGMDKITVASIDLTSFVADFSDEYAIVLPEGLTNLTDKTTAKVNVKVSGLSTAEFAANKFSAINNTDGYKVDIVTDSLTVLLRGSDGALDSISADDITIEADLSSQRNATGTYTVPATVKISGVTAVDAVGEYKVTVTITAG